MNKSDLDKIETPGSLSSYNNNNNNNNNNIIIIIIKYLYSTYTFQC